MGSSVRCSVFSERNIQKKFPNRTSTLTPTFRTSTTVLHIKQTQTVPNTKSNMKWLIVIALLAANTYAYNVEEEDNGEARLGYISVASGGATSLTFNATSIQNAVILGLFLLVLGALLLPLFGINMGEEEAYGEGYGYEATGYEEPAYQEPATGYGAGYAKRSLLQQAGPLLSQLSATRQKYEEEE